MPQLKRKVFLVGVFVFLYVLPVEAARVQLRDGRVLQGLSNHHSVT